MNTPCDVGIVMVTYNSYSKMGNFFLKVLDSLVSLKDIHNLNIVFVDNGSRDETVRVINETLNGKVKYRVIRVGRNLGLPMGYNIGAVALKECKYLLFMNDDVILAKNTVEVLKSAMRKDIGAVQPLIIHLNGYIEHGFDMGLSGVVIPTIKPIDHEIVVPVVTGCCIMVPSGVFFKVGMFRGELFWGYDDADFCWRLHNHGYKCLVVSKAYVIHYGSASWGKENPLKLYLGFRNWLYCLIKNTKLWLLPFQIMLAVLLIINTLVYLIKHKDYKALLMLIKALDHTHIMLKLVTVKTKRGLPNFDILADARTLPLINRLLK